MPCGRRCGQSGFQRRQRCLPAPPRVTVPGRHQATVGARGTDGRVAEQTGFWRLILCHARVGGTRERSWAPPACGGRKRGERLPGAGSPPAFVNLQEPCHPVGGRGGLSRLWRLSGCGCTLTPPPPPPRDEHIGALLAVRGDASRDMKQTIIETLEQGPAQASPDYVPIFKDIVVPSLNVAKLLK